MSVTLGTLKAVIARLPFGFSELRSLNNYYCCYDLITTNCFRSLKSNGKFGFMLSAVIQSDYFVKQAVRPVLGPTQSAPAPCKW